MFGYVWSDSPGRLQESPVFGGSQSRPRVVAPGILMMKCPCTKAQEPYSPSMFEQHTAPTTSRYRYTKKLRGHCTTRNLVYFITCTKYAKQYVGETKRELKYGMAEHVRDTRVKRETPVSIHFNEPDHLFENMIFQIIQILPTDPEDDRSTTKRRQCERYWIYQLHSLEPLGINVFG